LDPEVLEGPESPGGLLNQQVPVVPVVRVGPEGREQSNQVLVDLVVLEFLQ